MTRSDDLEILVDAIMALINSQLRSPTRDEIVAVVRADYEKREPAITSESAHAYRVREAAHVKRVLDDIMRQAAAKSVDPPIIKRTIKRFNADPT